MRMTVLVDLDDVVADWRGQVIRDAQKILGDSNVFIHGRDYEVWDMISEYRKGFGEEAVQAILQAINAPGFHESLPPIEGAMDALQQLDHDGFDAYILTWPWLGHRSCAGEKLNWVRDKLGSYWEKRTIISANKVLVRGDLLIDDRPDAAKHGNGHDPSWQHILFTNEDWPFRPHLSDHPATHRMHGWAELPRILQEHKFL
jgi:5'-nucleotidase